MCDNGIRRALCYMNMTLLQNRIGLGWVLTYVRFHRATIIDLAISDFKFLTNRLAIRNDVAEPPGVGISCHDWSEFSIALCFVFVPSLPVRRHLAKACFVQDFK